MSNRRFAIRCRCHRDGIRGVDEVQRHAVCVIRRIRVAAVERERRHRGRGSEPIHDQRVREIVAAVDGERRNRTDRVVRGCSKLDHRQTGVRQGVEQQIDGRRGTGRGDGCGSQR